MTLTRPSPNASHSTAPTPGVLDAPTIGAVSRAAFKFTASIVRRLKLMPEASDWTRRAEACERCPMRVVQCGTSYCGKPFLKLPIRDPVADGCGCPTRAKAKDPVEHCPVNARYVKATTAAGACDCKWCALSTPATTSGR